MGGQVTPAQVVLADDVARSTNKRDIAVKLHMRFGHPSWETLIKIVRNAGITDILLEVEIFSISQECLFCL